ncbi:MAG: APC family permease [Candidatus Sericytochromatia bacterium]|nr:APC family permease [Candidatus Tanganyikabacteria bacterium]
MITETTGSAAPKAGSLQRTVGFGGLLFMSLGSIIGSGWLLGALNAAVAAGPASILSWILAAGMLSLLALTFAELGAAYPVAGGGGRFPYYSHGPVAGFVAGWASWLQAVFIAPIEVLACITYVNSVDWVNQNFNMITRTGPQAGLLNQTGLIVAVCLLLVFTAINLASVKVVSESNSLVVVWKTLVPVLAVVCLPFIAFHPENFTAGGGFMPFGFHGVFAALTGGVVFALQGFEQAVQLAGEARNPRRDLSRAVLTAMAIGAVLYAALQITMLGLLEPANIRDGWAHPLGSDPSAYGAWYTIALALGAGWLAKALLIDAVVSPAGTGVVYITTTARLSYALGEEREMPSALTRTNRRGVPVVSILLAAGVGLLALGPFKSWNALVSVATGSTAIMYAFAPIALASLHKVDADRPRSYRVPYPRLVLPGAFCSANLIMYWGGFGLTWKLALAMLAGLVLFGIGAKVRKTGAWAHVRHAVWIPGWLGGQVLIGYLGRYGEGTLSVLPAWVDLGVVILFAVGIFRWAVSCALSPEGARAAVQKDAAQLEAAPEPVVVSALS